MSTSPHEDDTSPDSTDGSAAADQSDEQRPQPRYGAYAPPSDAGQLSEAAQQAEPYNPYAQPSWGQPSPQNPYDTQQPQQPGGHPQQDHTAPQRPKRPATLWTVLAALLAAGATSLIWGLYVLVTLPAQSISEVFGGTVGDAFVEELQRQSAQDPDLQEFSPQELEEATLVMIGVMALIWAAVLLALYITTAFLGAMAGNPGRILATIWASLSLLFFALGHDGASYGLISATVCFSVVAIVMMWLPDSSKYVRHRKWEKENMRSGYQGHPVQQ